MWTLLRQEDFNDRNSTHNRVLPITIRSYETLIRLSTSHAKLYQSEYVQIRDCIEAFRLMIYCLYADCHALDDKLREILRRLNLDDGSAFEKPDEPKQRNARSSAKKDNKKMEDEASKVLSKLSKMDISKDDK
jgi:DNA replication licensing factor MCM3